jgi:5-methylcytosine-specific restriction endonuclease McrA
MPAPNIKTIRDLIFYQYAKIIAESSGFSKKNFQFIMNRVNKLRSGEINMSTITRELKMQISSTERKCEYCGNPENLSWDHIIPQSKCGPDTADNLILCCKSCNSSKGSSGLYEWFSLENKDTLPRVVAGKYLKLLFDVHEKNGTLENAAKTVLDLEIY